VASTLEDFLPKNKRYIFFIQRRTFRLGLSRKVSLLAKLFLSLLKNLEDWQDEISKIFAKISFKTICTEGEVMNVQFR
jgi:hypothetical protein